MSSNTIKESIKKVLAESREGLTIKEIYDRIIKNDLFEFKAKNPIAVLSAELKKSCEGFNLKKGRPEKIFKLNEANKYSLVNAKSVN